MIDKNFSDVIKADHSAIPVDQAFAVVKEWFYSDDVWCESPSGVKLDDCKARMTSGALLTLLMHEAVNNQVSFTNTILVAGKILEGELSWCEKVSSGLWADALIRCKKGSLGMRLAKL